MMAGSGLFLPGSRSSISDESVPIPAVSCLFKKPAPYLAVVLKKDDAG